MVHTALSKSLKQKKKTEAMRKKLLTKRWLINAIVS